MRSVILAVMIVAGCGGDPGVTVDAATGRDAALAAALDAAPDAAAGPDLSCLGQPAPTGGGAMAIGGKVFAVDHYDVVPAVGAAVELRRTSDDGIVGQATAAGDGGFAIAAPGPVAGYFVVTATGHVPTRAFSDLPLTADDDALLLVADSAELARWYGDAGTVHVAGARTVVTAVRDCARHTIAGSTVGIAPASGVVYYDQPGKRWNPALAASTNGFALATSTAASVTITPRHLAAVFPSETVAALPDVLTLFVTSPYD